MSSNELAALVSEHVANFTTMDNVVKCIIFALSLLAVKHFIMNALRRIIFMIIIAVVFIGYMFIK